MGIAKHKIKSSESCVDSTRKHVHSAMCDDPIDVLLTWLCSQNVPLNGQSIREKVSEFRYGITFAESGHQPIVHKCTNISISLHKIVIIQWLWFCLHFPNPNTFTTLIGYNKFVLSPALAVVTRLYCYTEVMSCKTCYRKLNQTQHPCKILCNP